MYYKPSTYGVDGFNNITVNNTQSGITTLTINTYTSIIASSSTKLTGYFYNNNYNSATTGTFYRFNISGLVNMSQIISITWIYQEKINGSIYFCIRYFIPNIGANHLTWLSSYSQYSIMYNGSFINPSQQVFYIQAADNATTLQAMSGFNILVVKLASY